MTRYHDLIVIGAGPGGYVAAIRAAQLGLNVGCVEKEPALGGTCLRIGCIPSKALLESSELFVEARARFASHGIKLLQVELDLPVMQRRKEQVVNTLTRGVDSLFKKNKITRYLGQARLAGTDGRMQVKGVEEEIELRAKNILIATGSKPGNLPGIELDGSKIGTSTEALAYDAPPKRLVVIGAGYIGLELGSVWRRLGSQVLVLEFLDRILSGIDREIANEAQKYFAKQGLEFRLGCKVTSARTKGSECVVEYETGQKNDAPQASASPKGSAREVCDRVLVAVGRKPNTDGLNLNSAGIELDQSGRIPVDEHFATGTPGIYAVGDVIRGPMLAHKAEEEGIACVEYIATGYGHVDYDAISAVVYTQPEIAAVGKTEEELTAAGTPFRKGVFPFRANARALTLGQTEGKIKILAHRDTDRILGVHILGARAGDLIAEAAAAIAFSASSEDLARTPHAHPTLAEALKEAALAVDGRTINV